MSSLLLVVKRCPACGEEKPTAEFYERDPFWGQDFCSMGLYLHIDSDYIEQTNMYTYVHIDSDSGVL